MKMIKATKTKKATCEDLSQIIRFENRVYFHEEELCKCSEQHSEQALDKLREEIKIGTVYILIVKDNNQIIGSVRIYDENICVCIKNLTIHPEYHNRRYEHRFLNSLEKYIENKNIKIYTNDSSVIKWYSYKRNSYKELGFQRLTENTDDIEYIYISRF